MGNSSVDYALKNYVRGRDEPVGEYWLALARKVSTDMLAKSAQAFGA
jgi:hypothetical protein